MYPKARALMQRIKSFEIRDKLKNCQIQERLEDI